LALPRTVELVRGLHRISGTTPACFSAPTPERAFGQRTVLATPKPWSTALRETLAASTRHGKRRPRCQGVEAAPDGDPVRSLLRGKPDSRHRSDKRCPRQRASSNGCIKPHYRITLSGCSAIGVRWRLRARPNGLHDAAVTPTAPSPPLRAAE